MVRPLQCQGAWHFDKAALILIKHVLNAFDSQIGDADRAVKAYKACLQCLGIRRDERGYCLKIRSNFSIRNALHLKQVTVEMGNFKERRKIPMPSLRRSPGLCR